MGRRTLQASSVGIQAIKRAIKQKKWSQDYLAGVAECTRQTIWSLLKGNPIDEGYFLAICQELGLDGQEIIIKTVELSEENDLEIKDFIADIRQRIEPMVRKGRC